MDWTSSGNLHSSQLGSPERDGSWARQAEMWVELEAQPVLKCNFPYIREDILMKIRRNLLLASPLWNPVLYRVQALQLSHSHREGMYDPALRCEVFSKEVKLKLWLFHQFPPLSSLDTYPFYRHCKNLISLKCSPPCNIWLVKVLKVARWKG